MFVPLHKLKLQVICLKSVVERIQQRRKVSTLNASVLREEKLASMLVLQKAKHQRWIVLYFTSNKNVCSDSQSNVTPASTIFFHKFGA